MKQETYIEITCIYCQSSIQGRDDNGRIIDDGLFEDDLPIVKGYELCEGEWYCENCKKAGGKGNFNIDDFKKVVGNTMLEQVRIELDMSDYLFDAVKDGIEKYLKTIGYTDGDAIETASALMEDNFRKVMCFWGVGTKAVFPDIEKINLSALRESK